MKLKLTLLMAVIFCCYSCSDNGNPDDTNSESDIVGVWNITDLRNESTTTVSAGGEMFITTLVSTGEDFDYTFTLNENPNTYISTGSYTSVNTITFNNITNTTRLVVNSIPGLENGTWALDGNVLTFNAENQSSTATITELTSNLMVWNVTYEITQTQQGQSATVAGELSVRLEK